MRRYCDVVVTRRLGLGRLAGDVPGDGRVLDAGDLAVPQRRPHEPGRRHAERARARGDPGRPVRPWRDRRGRVPEALGHAARVVAVSRATRRRSAMNRWKLLAAAAAVVAVTAALTFAAFGNDDPPDPNAGPVMRAHGQQMIANGQPTVDSPNQKKH